MEYTFVEINDMTGSGETKMSPTPVHSPQIAYKDFLKECARGTGIDAGIFNSVLSRVADRMIFYTEMGHSVKIDPLGTFRAKLAMKEGFSAPTKEDLKTRHNTENVEIKSMNFIASKEFVNEFRERTRLVYCGSDHELREITTTPEERLQMALDFLDTHYELRLIDYRRLTGLARSTASRELIKFSTGPDAKLERWGSSNQLRYHKREE